MTKISARKKRMNLLTVRNEMRIMDGEMPRHGE